MTDRPARTEQRGEVRGGGEAQNIFMKSIEIEEEAWTNNMLLSTRVDSRPPMKWHGLLDVTQLQVSAAVGRNESIQTTLDGCI